MLMPPKEPFMAHRMITADVPTGTENPYVLFITEEWSMHAPS